MDESFDLEWHKKAYPELFMDKVVPRPFANTTSFGVLRYIQSTNPGNVIVSLWYHNSQIHKFFQAVTFSNMPTSKTTKPHDKEKKNAKNMMHEIGRCQKDRPVFCALYRVLWILIWFIECFTTL